MEICRDEGSGKLMKHVIQFGVTAGLALALMTFAAPQRAAHTSASQPPDQRDVELPNGKFQKDEILKANHEKDLKDAAQLIELAEQLKQELEKNDRHVLSLSSLKKTEQIEKLAKRIRSRLVH